MEEDKTPNPKKQLKNLGTLSGIAIQMGVTIYLFVTLGKWLDAKYNEGNKGFIVVMTLLGVGISFYALIKQIQNLKN